MKQVSVKNTNQFSFLFIIMAIAISLIAMMPSQGFALTPAGTVVGNQATATYNDTAGNQFTAQSNLFIITVSQVAGLTLTPSSQSRAGAPANEVQFPHTITNPGNGTDTFNLTTATGGAVTLNSITIIRDDNGDGTANPGEPAITSVTLNMSKSQLIVVRATIPSSAANGTAGTITLTATTTLPGFSNNQSSVNTANVVTTAVISLAKSASVLSANPGATLDTTVNYTNVGVASTAGIPVVLDTVSVTRHVVRNMIPASTTFSSFLGTPTPTGGQLVYHATGALEHTYVTAVPASFDAVAYLFTTPLNGGQSGVFSFRVTMNASSQVGTISDQAIMYFNNGSIDTSQTSNTTGVAVNLIPSVAIRDTDTPLDDIQIVSSGSAGSPVFSVIRVENTSNGADRYNITVANGNYPSGTTFALLGIDGITPLLDTNADGVPDTGLVNAASTFDIVMKATLPANAGNTGAPFNATTTATSVANSAISDSVTNRLSTIIGPGVDITNTSAGAGAPGAGPGPGASPIVTVFGNPGATVNVDLHLRNTGPNPDSFDVQFGTSTTFAPGVLPVNVSSILFFIGDGSGNPTGAPIMSTGQIPAGGNKEVIAQVTVSPGVAGATDIDLFFRGISVASAATDIIMDRLTVNTIREISLLQKQSGQASAGSATTYSHVLKNLGNVTEPQINLAATNSQPGFLTTIYLDNNGDGLINGTDAVITSAPALVAGSSTSLVIRVAAPSSAANGAVDSMTLTATPTGIVNTVNPPAAQSNIDQTTVVTGQVEMTLAANPSGSQPPGTTITYTISYQNVGAAEVSSLLITDAIPVNTTYVLESMRLNATTVLNDAANGDAGTLIGGQKGSVQFNIGTVASGVSGTVSFQVTID